MVMSRIWSAVQCGLFRQLDYQPIRVSNDDDEEVGESIGSESPRHLPRCNGRLADKKQHDRLALPRILFSLVCLLVSLSYLMYRMRHQVSDKLCARRMSAPSPVLDALDFEWVTFHDHFEPDIYSGYPTKSSEKAWADLWDFGAFGVPLEHLSGLNKSSLDGDFRLVELEKGGGVGGLLEGAHQIHCLNLIRQFIYKDHWDYSNLPSFSGGEKARRHHVDHCIATLRTVLTCLADVTPYYLVKSADSDDIIGRGAPHKCRVYQRMVDWVGSHSVFDSIEE